MTDWELLERSAALLPRRAVAAVAARAARRVVPGVAAAVPVFGPEAWEWMSALDAVVRTVERFAAGEAVSRFTLDLAAEVARGTATATAAAARRVGPSPVVETLELAYAAAAFAADAARVADPHRAARLAVQGCRSAAETPGVARLIELDLKLLAGSSSDSVDSSEAGSLGELWPLGEPAGWREFGEGFAVARVGLLPILG